jgi:hypothetical protein
MQLIMSVLIGPAQEMKYFLIGLRTAAAVRDWLPRVTVNTW